MQVDIKNNSSHKDAPIAQMEKALSVQGFHFTYRWPGAHNVYLDLLNQGFYLSLVDTLPEAPGALGYHDVDGEGRPYSKIAVKPSFDHGDDWVTGDYSIVSILGHEFLETLGDPLCNLWVVMPDGSTLTAREVCDPVEATGYRHNGMDLTNFVTPAWYNPFAKPPYDYAGELMEPFTMTGGGYMLINSGGQVSQKFADYVPAWRKVMRPRAAMRGLIIPGAIPHD